MRSDDPPALGHSHPGLALPSDSRFTYALELNIRGREIPPEGGNCSVSHHALEIGWRTSRAKRLDRIVAVQIFGGAIAQRMRAFPEQFVEHGDIVGNQRSFVSSDARRDFGHYLGEIDLHQAIRHCATPASSSALAAARQTSSRHGALINCTPIGR